MEEVRSYWQVASISHFCNLFGKPFKLPTFEPEELEQAFILDVPIPPNQKQQAQQPDSQLNDNSNDDDVIKDGELKKRVGFVEPDEGEEDEEPKQNCNDNDNKSPTQQEEPNKFNSETSNYISNNTPINGTSNYHSNFNNHATTSTTTQQESEPTTDQQTQKLHLLVKLAIALIKPHFNTKITHLNWETYLKRLVDTYWVDLEHHPSPFKIPLVTQGGVELIKNLTFNDLPLSDKIDLIYALCDYRFWCEDAAEAIKDYTIDELRLESIGKDSQGYEYWYFSGTRLFLENKELSQDIILRKKRIKELEYKLIELEKNRILKEEEEKRKAEVERARQLAAEAREAKLTAKRQQQEQEAQSKKRKSATPILPPRTGLRERRSSAASNSNHTLQLEQQSSRTTRSRLAKAQQPAEELEQQQADPPTAKTTRGAAKSSKLSNKESTKKCPTPDINKRSPEEECKAELERLTIKPEDRAEAWRMECDSLEDWEKIAVKFEKTKSTNEKYLSNYINEEILPRIRAIYAKRAAEVRRKEKELLLSLTSRRVSTRIISKKTQEEEEERRAQQHEVESRKKKLEAETRLKAELEREMRIRQNRFVINGETAPSSACSEDGDDNGRYNLRQTITNLNSLNGVHEFDGIIHPDNLSDFYEAIELVVDTVRTSKHAWPFVDPVADTVPGYYDLIKEPMDLRKLRTKIEFREYRSLFELERDFQLLVNNCERFNGPKNVYTKMVYKLWKSFRKNVRLYLERDLSMDEYETFIYPPQPPAPPPLIEQEEELEQNEATDQKEELENFEQDTFKVEQSAIEMQPQIYIPEDIEMEIVDTPIDHEEEEIVLKYSPIHNNHKETSDLAPSAEIKHDPETPKLPSPICNLPTQTIVKSEENKIEKSPPGTNGIDVLATTTKESMIKRQTSPYTNNLSNGNETLTTPKPNIIGTEHHQNAKEELPPEPEVELEL